MHLQQCQPNCGRREGRGLSASCVVMIGVVTCTLGRSPVWGHGHRRAWDVAHVVTSGVAMMGSIHRFIGRREATHPLLHRLAKGIVAESSQLTGPCGRNREGDAQRARKQRMRQRARGRLADCTEEARQPTDFRAASIAGPRWQADTGPPCSPAKALHPAPIRHWKIPARLAQTARRCREGAEQVSNRRTPAPTLRVTFVQWQQTTGLGFVSLHHEAKFASRSQGPKRRGSLKIRSSHLIPNLVLECSPSNDQSDSEPQVVCYHHLERSAAPHFFPNPGT